MPVITQFMECLVAQLALESLQFMASKEWHTEIRAEEHSPAPELLPAGAIKVQVYQED